MASAWVPKQRIAKKKKEKKENKRRNRVNTSRCSENKRGLNQVVQDKRAHDERLAG